MLRSSLAIIVVLCAPLAAAAQATTFRTLSANLVGDQVQIEVSVQQGSSAIQLDFYGHATLPKHRNVNVPGPAVTDGLKLGSVTPASGSTTVQKLTIAAEALRKVGIDPGKTLQVAMKCPGFGDNGGHEWGVNAGSSDYNTGTSVVLQAARNAAWRPRPGGAWLCARPWPLSRARRGGATFGPVPWRPHGSSRRR